MNGRHKTHTQKEEAGHMKGMVQPEIKISCLLKLVSFFCCRTQK